MTKKHFAALAEEIAKIPDEKARHGAALAVARACEKSNDKFNGPKFFKACKAELA